MLFRSTFGTSSVEEILDRADAEDTEGAEISYLLELLDQPDVLAEENLENKRLFQFFARRAVVKELVELCVSEPTTEFPDQEAELKRRFKYPFIASEVLSSENYRLSDSLLRNPDLVNGIFGYFDRNSPAELDGTKATYAAKIISALLRCKNIEVLHYTTHNAGFIPSLLKHLSQATVVELLLRFLDGPDGGRFFSSGVGQPRKEALDLVAHAQVLKKLADALVECAHDDVMADRQREESIVNASMLIQHISVRALQLKKMSVPIPSDLSVYAIPEDVVGAMLDAGIQDYVRKDNGRSSTLIATLTTCSELLSTDANDYDGDADQATRYSSVNSVIAMMAKMQTPRMFGSVGNSADGTSEATSSSSRRTLENQDAFEAVLRKRFEELNKILVEERPSNSFTNTVGRINNPFGITRFKILEFFVICLRYGSPETVDALLELQLPDTFQRIFFTYPWNSMVLNTATAGMVHALEHGSDATKQAWLTSGFTAKLASAWLDSNKDEATQPRAGNLGHIVVVSKSAEQTLREMQSKQIPTALPEDEVQAFLDFCEERISKELERQNEGLLAGRSGQEQGIKS